MVAGKLRSKVTTSEFWGGLYAHSAKGQLLWPDSLVRDESPYGHASFKLPLSSGPRVRLV